MGKKLHCFAIIFMACSTSACNCYTYCSLWM